MPQMPWPDNNCAEEYFRIYEKYNFQKNVLKSMMISQFDTTLYCTANSLTILRQFQFIYNINNSIGVCSSHLDDGDKHILCIGRIVTFALITTNCGLNSKINQTLYPQWGGGAADLAKELF